MFYCWQMFSFLEKTKTKKTDIFAHLSQPHVQDKPKQTSKKKKKPPNIPRLTQVKVVKVAQLCPTPCNPMEFSRPEYWNG